MNRDTLEQDPCSTCGYEEGSIYCKEHCPHEAGIEQEPCEMTAEEYRQRMIQAFHNADCDGLIAICVLPTEKEFEHLEWLLKNHYKKEPCGDAIDRAEAIKIASGYCHPANVAKELAKLPPVNPQSCEDAISKQAVFEIQAKYAEYMGATKFWQMSDDIKALPPVTPQPKTGHWIDDNENEIDAQYGRHLYRCSKCNEYADMFIGGTEDWWDLEKPNYCPNCGAKMVEPQEI